MALVLTGGTAGLVAAGGNMLLAEGLAGGMVAAETIAVASTAASATAAASTAVVVAEVGAGVATLGGGSSLLGAGMVVSTLTPLGWVVVGVGVAGEEIISDEFNSQNNDIIDLFGVNIADTIL